ncbi:MAG TPA: trigger factor [Acidimicrobiales bacterium]|jgi:trigger factor|nr:trigger factor [Acidimicrobiales bacterium]
MKSAIEPLEGNKVKVSVSLDATEFEKALDDAFRKIAREVRIPGFRPGKAPRRILEARLGKETGRAEALRDALPDYYAQAIREHDVDAIAPPEIDITGGQEGGDVAFDAIVEVRPHLELSGYGGIKVTVPNPAVTEDDIAARIDRLRGNFGELSTAERPARGGDHLTIDIKGTRGGEAVSGMTVDDYSYELGSGDVLPELDERLTGAKPGDILNFDAEHPDGPVELSVLIKEVREKVLPEVTDEWASDASEFDTAAELRADIVEQLTATKKMAATMAMRQGVVDGLIALVSDEPPAALVNSAVESRAHDFGHRLEAQGATVEQYLAATGQSQEEIVAEWRQGAVLAVKADLALRAVADAEGIDATGADIDAEIERLAPTYKISPTDLRAQLERGEQIPAVRSDLRKNKALEWLVEHAEVVDEEGRPVDRTLLGAPEDQSSESGEA